MALAHFRMLTNEMLNKDTYIVPEEAPLIILDSKSYVCMDKNGKYTKQKIHISRRVHFVRNLLVLHLVFSLSKLKTCLDSCQNYGRFP